MISEGDIDQISFHLKHINGLKIAGNHFAPGYWRDRTWAVIMKPDIIFSEDAIYEISIQVNQIHGPGELKFIVHQIKPLISISFVEFCLQLYVYRDIYWRWDRAIGRETVYYTRRPLRTIYLLMAGRKPIFSKTVCHMWPWNSQPWLFYITILYLYSDTLYLLSDIYYLLSII